MSQKKKSIYVAYTGGTIGMKPSTEGYVPAENFLAKHLASMPEFQRPELPEFTLKEYHPLIDSANMDPAHWQIIAQDIAEQYHHYDGFVVLHGTDTMAYTASALSFMLENLGKPVIVTGSQIPLAQLRSDGHANLLNALYLAANHPVAEVGLFFNNKLLRGNRSVKAHADGFDAFASPNFPPLLEAGININWIAGEPGVPNNHKDSLNVKPIDTQPIGVMTLYPGICAEVIRNFIHQPVRALIIQSFGVGNAPKSPEFIEAIREADAKGVIVLNCTQCLKGTVDMQGYATGNALAKAGVVSGHDMTIEAALAKLHYLLSQNLSQSQIKQKLSENLRGEMTR
ncbi:MAG: asparaginase [Cellvibrionaceae bacterium]